MNPAHSSNARVNVFVRKEGCTENLWQVPGQTICFTGTKDAVFHNIAQGARKSGSDPHVEVLSVVLRINGVAYNVDEEFLSDPLYVKNLFNKRNLLKLPTLMVYCNLKESPVKVVPAPKTPSTTRSRKVIAPGTSDAHARSANPARSRADSEVSTHSLSAPAPPVPTRAPTRLAAHATATAAQAIDTAAATIAAAGATAAVAASASVPASTPAAAPAPASTVVKKTVKKVVRQTKPEVVAARKKSARVVRGLNLVLKDVGPEESTPDDAQKLSAFDLDEASDASDSDEEEVEVEEEVTEICEVSEPQPSAGDATTEATEVAAATVEPVVAELPASAVPLPCTPPRVPETTTTTTTTTATAVPCTPLTTVVSVGTEKAPGEAPATPAAAVAPKTPGRSASRNRGGMRSSILSSTKSSIKRSTDDTSLYASGRTYSEQNMHILSSLHSTTGALALSHASKVAAMASARNTPAKRPAQTPHKKDADCDDPFALQMASASRIKRNPDGRPSIGTIEQQWEYMRQSFFNNDDEEIVWSMVSRNKGAYKHAHAKYEKAEDRYFKSLYDITLMEGRIESITTGPAAKVSALVQELGNMCNTYQEVPKSKETNEKIDAALEKLRGIIASGSPDKVIGSIDSDNSVLDVFSRINAEKILDIVTAPEAKRSDTMRTARTVGPLLRSEAENLRMKLKQTNKASEEALEYMEKWSRRERDALDYGETMRQQEEDWLATHFMENMAALSAMREFIPANIADLSVAELMAAAKAQGGLFSLELATELKQNKLLHWIVTHTDDIATDSFLTGDRKVIFEGFEALDVTELRALAVVLPKKFENDKDGRKADWRARFYAKVRAVVSQQQRELVKGPYDPSQGKRAMVPQPELKPEQVRRSVYSYRTKEKSVLKVKQYNDRLAALARREAALTQAEAAAAQAKAEYDIVLTEMRDPDFIREYGAEQLTQAKETAKNLLNEANSTLKQARTDLTHLQNTIAAMPLSREQYLEQEAELVAYMQERGFDWNAPRQAPQPIQGVFDPNVEPTKLERAETAKFLSAEEEAAQRKLEMELLLSRKAEAVVAGADEAELGAALAGQTTEGAGEAREGCVTPALGASQGAAAAPTTEFRRVSMIAAAGLFSPHPAAAGTSAVPEFTTPRKRNSVLLNANPEMLSKLNAMLLNSPTPMKANSRASIMPMSAVKAVAVADDVKASEAPQPEKRKVVSTRSRILKSLVSAATGGSATSPKRNPLSALDGTSAGTGMGERPKLGFLAQIAARAGLRSGTASEGAESNPAVSSAPAPSAPARSLFADIARFRKPDAEETSVTATAAVKAEAEAVVEEKENASAAAVNALPFAPAAGVGSAMKPPRPMLSLFDEIRKRRVVE